MINTYTFNVTIISLFYDKFYIYRVYKDIDYLDLISTDTIRKPLQTIPVASYYSRDFDSYEVKKSP